MSCDMIAKPFLHLSYATLEQFRDFLDKQEAKLADVLLLATSPAINSKTQGPLHLHGSGHFRLSQALQALTTRMRHLREGDTTLSEWRSAVLVINKAFWDYVEVLEEAEKELSHHVEAVDISGWTENFYRIVVSFKELLAHRIEDLIWVTFRVEDLLLTYRSICKKRKNLWMVFGYILKRFSNTLDRAILQHLYAAESALSAQYKAFNTSYEALNSFMPEIKLKEAKFLNFSLWNEKDPEHQRLMIKLYEWIALYEKNSKLEALDPQLILRAIKNVAKPGLMSAIFRECIDGIKKNFFQDCISWQNERDPSIRIHLQTLEEGLDHLKTFIGSYREILLRAESDPYAKTRRRLTEWIVGPEPRKTRDFLQLLYQIDFLKRLFSTLFNSLDRQQTRKASVKGKLRQQIYEVLHEMGQPLSSRNLIQGRAEKLIELIGELDELGSSEGDVHDLITEVLLRALHYDAKYQVLNNDSRFEEIITIHQNLGYPIEDPEHLNRIKVFKSVIKHVENWLKKKEIQNHIHELDLDEGAVQESLQGLLASVQRGSYLEETCYEMLLEYRYLFSRFFHALRKYETEGKEIRSQFSFVDHYLEAIEQQVKADSKVI